MKVHQLCALGRRENADIRPTHTKCPRPNKPRMLIEIFRMFSKSRGLERGTPAGERFSRGVTKCEGQKTAFVVKGLHQRRID